MTVRTQMSEVLKEEPRRIIGDLPKRQTIQDLFDCAEYKWGLTEQEVRKALRGAGHTKWNGMLWDTYISNLRSFWLKKHVAELEAEGRGFKDHAEEVKQLTWLESQLKLVYTVNGCHFEGTPEQLEAHWALENIRRKENIARTRRRLYYG